MIDKRSLTDRQMLEALSMRGNGVTLEKIGERFGRSKGAMAGLMNRIDKGADMIGPALDGTMPADWWEAGLKKQEQS